VLAHTTVEQRLVTRLQGNVIVRKAANDERLANENCFHINEEIKRIEWHWELFDTTQFRIV
jgi:hypothetical protein